MSDKRLGTLFIVSTPIGNLGDITFRAVDVLRNVRLIAAEDTRRTRILTTQYNIKTPLTSYYSYNRIKKGEYILKRLKSGDDVALVSDAGTPGISDPGCFIIREVIAQGIPVMAIPGPTALIAALVISGLPTDRFVFEGFLPSKSGARRNRLRMFLGEKRTVVLYESPHRLLKTLNDIKTIFGDIKIVCVREITKKFEDIRRQRVTDLVKHFNLNKPRGEFIVIFNPRYDG